MTPVTHLNRQLLRLVWIFLLNFTGLCKQFKCDSSSQVSCGRCEVWIVDEQTDEVSCSSCSVGAPSSPLIMSEVHNGDQLCQRWSSLIIVLIIFGSLLILAVFSALIYICIKRKTVSKRVKPFNSVLPSKEHPPNIRILDNTSNTLEKCDADLTVNPVV